MPDRRLRAGQERRLSPAASIRRGARTWLVQPLPSCQEQRVKEFLTHYTSQGALPREITERRPCNNVNYPTVSVELPALGKLCGIAHFACRVPAPGDAMSSLSPFLSNALSAYDPVLFASGMGNSRFNRN